MHKAISQFLWGCLLTLVYFVSAKISLSFAYFHPSSSPVWLPTGIALSAVLFKGNKIWPAIFVGAFLANMTTDRNLLSSLGIATGNTLEAIVGAYWLHHYSIGRRSFNRTLYVFKFILLAAMGSTAMSATFGVTSLALVGAAPWHDYGVIWFTWWLGDMMSNLVLTPFLLVWGSKPVPQITFLQILEALFLFLFMIFIGGLIFEGWFSFEEKYLLAFLSLPVLLWVTFRFRQRGATLSNVLVSVLAIFSTVRGIGPFAAEDPNQSLLFLQAFLGCISVTTLVLASSVSELIATEKALQARKGEDKFRAVTETTPDAVITANSRGNVVYFNKGAERIFGVTMAEMIGQPLTRLMPERFHASHLEGMKNYLVTGQKRVIGRTVELVGIRRDGREFPLDLSLAVWEVEGQKFFTGILRDISERKRSENALRKTHDELELKVKKRTQELANANQELEEILMRLKEANEHLRQLDKLKSNFIMRASHELRTPLSSIIGYLSLLFEGKAGELNDVQRDFLYRVHLATERLKRMLTDLLNLSKIESGQVTFNFKPQGIEKILEEQVQLFQGQANQKEIGMSLKIEKPLGEVLCDEDRLGEAIGNFLSNAIKYTSRKGSIRVRACRKDEEIILEVEDTGLGIAPEQLDRIFEPFFHAHATGSEGEESSGLGLALVKEIVDRHQGHVHVKSSPGLGSVFTMILPVLKR